MRWTSRVFALDGGQGFPGGGIYGGTTSYQQDVMTAMKRRS
jgi:hypothetical protein